MPGLFTALRNSSQALRAFERALAITENNVANAATPGYAKQRAAFRAAPFDPSHGLTGGVLPAAMESSRNRYLDAEVRRALAGFGYADQKAVRMEALEPAWDATGESGIPAVLDELFASFSSWSVSPNSAVERQAVLSAADSVARSFRDMARTLGRAAQDAQAELEGAVASVNRLGARLRALNAQRAHGGEDAGLDAELTATLEELSEWTEVTALHQPDGTVTVLLGGEVPLVIGTRQYELSTDFSQGAAGVLDGGGAQIAGKPRQGRLGALVEVYDRVLPALRADLDRMAEAVAGEVNGLLASGLTDAGQPGGALFVFDATGGAASLSLNPALAPEELAAIDPGPPYSSNGIALRLAALAQAPQDVLSGMTFSEFYGAMAARVGQETGQARAASDAAAQAAVQTRGVRDAVSGVSLDEEAAYLIQFQRAYEATARVITVVSELTETTINLLR